MTEVIMTVVCIGILSAVLSLFFGENGELSKYVRFAASLCFLCALIGGGKRLASQFDFSFDMPYLESDYDVSSASESYYDELSKEISRELEEKLVSNIVECTGIIVNDCSIQLNVTMIGEIASISFEKIVLHVDNNTAVDLLSEHILSVCGISTEIIYDSENGEQ